MGGLSVIGRISPRVYTQLNQDSYPQYGHHWDHKYLGRPRTTQESSCPPQAFLSLGFQFQFSGVILYTQDGAELSAPTHPTGPSWPSTGLPASGASLAWPPPQEVLGLTGLGFSFHTAGASLPHGCLTCPSAGGLAWRSPNLGASHHQRESRIS